jgi:prophage DNA circulation protein
MATIKQASPAPWRLRLIPAQFAGVTYHVEQQARQGGRRVVLHEYPKKDTPYAESMGRQAMRYQVTGYLIGPNYDQTKRQLINVLENSDGGQLVDPYLATPKLCICERYSVTEIRERGGYCAFEMSFVEVGTPGNTAQQDTAGDTTQKAETTSTAAADVLDGATPLGQGGVGHA